MAHRFRPIIVAFVVLSIILPQANPGPRHAVHAQETGPRLVEESASGVVFELAVPLPELSEVEVEGQSFQRLDLPGFSSFGKPGHPALLQAGVLIGVPPEGDVTVRLLDSQVEDLAGSYRLDPVPALELVYDQAGEPDPQAGVVSRFVLDEAAYAQDSYVPAEVAVLEEVGFVRQQRVARISLRPVQYNPALGALRVHRALRVEVSFAQPAMPSKESAQPENEIDALLAGQLLNGSQARGWQAPRAPQAEAAHDPLSVYPGDTTRSWFRTSVRQSGLHRITRTDLQQPGLAALAAANPANLQVWKDGRQVPAHWIGDSDAVFEANELLAFYADVEPSIYSSTDAVWLTANGGSGLRMNAADASPTGAVTDTSWPAVLHLEEDLIFKTDLPLRETPSYPRWYWTDVYNISSSRTIYAALPNIATSGYNATIRLRLYGNTALVGVNPDHQVRVELNGQLAGEITWDGRTEMIGVLQTPASRFVRGLNKIVLSAPGALPGVLFDQSYLDWIDIEYQQQSKALRDQAAFTITGSSRREFAVSGFTGQNVYAYDVSNAAAPVVLTGGQMSTAEALAGDGEAMASPAAPAVERRVFLPTLGGTARQPAATYTFRYGATISSARSFALARPEGMQRVGPIVADTGSNLRAGSNRADYLLITHASLATVAQTLAAHRRSTGLTVAQIDVQDIYDEFSHGRLDPHAIRDFIGHAYQNWQAPAPRYVLLLGDGHYDYRYTTGLTSQPILIPPYYDDVDPWVGEVAVDNEFVAVSGNDRMPDLAIGRLPAGDAASASLMVNKIIAYETTAPSGAWRGTLAFVADNYRAADGTPDPAGNFELLSEGVIALVPPQYGVQRIYYDPYPNDDNNEPYRYRTPEATTQAIINAVNAGRVFVNYTGHASTTTWAHEAILRARDVGRNDVALMMNGPRQPIFLDMACVSGNFADPEFTSVEGMLLGWSQGGSIAGWGATGFGVATGHDQLHQGFYRSVFADGVRSLGVATMAGKLKLWQANHDLDLLDTFGLLGDPALRINLAPLS